MRFIADSMLGRLARWLRLLGYDTLYYPQIDDSRLLRIARQDNRILLTRDTRLVEVRGLQHFLLLKENDPFEQLKHVLTTFKLKANSESPEDTVRTGILKRCAVCNSLLNDITKKEVKGLIPDYVYKTSDVFRQCSGCGKLYWKGTHPEKIREKLSEILQSS